MKKQIETKGLCSGVSALVMGLGLHGGGVATVKWLLRNGAQVTATDMRTKQILAPSVAALKGFSVKYVLGEHRHVDFRENNLIVVNPGVPRESEYLKTAMMSGQRIENDASLFFRYCSNPVIAITGTRGKTTVTLWIAEILKKKYPKVLPSGNTPDNAFLKEFDRINGKDVPAVAEMSSWQLEHLPTAGRAPHVAVITNLYPDHLNRYRGIKDYASAKANIFIDQQSGDFLILNFDNEWTKYFLKKKPKALLFFASKKILPKNLNGIYIKNEQLVFRFDGIEQQLFSIKKFAEERGTHNLENLMHAVLAVKLYDSSVSVSERDVLKLPTPKMRQEIILKKGRLMVINDSCATSPDGTIAAIHRFNGVIGLKKSPTMKSHKSVDTNQKLKGSVVLIAGGTDKELEFDELAKTIKKHILLENLILIEGSATTKLIKELQNTSRTLLDIKPRKDLYSCVEEAFQKAQNLRKIKKESSSNHPENVIILFSPGASSFEKFLHEFDRGEQFNKLVKKHIK